MKKKLIALALVVALTLVLGACNDATNDVSSAPTSAVISSQTPSVTIHEPNISTESKIGYFSTEIKNPIWLNKIDLCDVVGDRIYLSGRSEDNKPILACFDTLTEGWQQIPFNADNLVNLSIIMLSASDNSIWLLLQENLSHAGIAGHNFSPFPEYYIYNINFDTGIETVNRLVWNESDGYPMSFIALDRNRLMIGNDGKELLIDNSANILDALPFNVQGEGLHARINNILYIQTSSGLAPFDSNTLVFGTAIPEIADQSVYSSSLGNILSTEDKTLYSYDLGSGEKEALFYWPDVSLSASNLYGWKGIENSEGDIYHVTSKITRVSKGEIPVKKALTLACLGDSSDPMYEYSSNKYTCTDELMDAIIRFNNSDPEFKIEIVPFIYNGENERNRVLIDLLTRKDIDLIDTSLLPAGSIDSKLLIDMLPYIDADNSISQDDFIPTLFNASIKNGGIYEFTNKYTILTMISHPEFISGSNWSCDDLIYILNENPALRLQSSGKELIPLFSYAASAEFIDWSNYRCNFDSAQFSSWLSVLKLLTDRDGLCENNSGPYLFNVLCDFAWQCGYNSRLNMQGDYIPVGFPDSSGTGSYFIKCGRPNIYSIGQLRDGFITMGCSTGLGIMASSRNVDGAWRFMRTFIEGEDEPDIIKGIPLLKSNFEKALNSRLNAPIDPNKDFEDFTISDAEYLKNLAYNTNAIVTDNDIVLDIIQTGMNNFISGAYSAEEIAGQIQSKISLLLAESE